MQRIFFFNHLQVSCPPGASVHIRVQGHSPTLPQLKTVTEKTTTITLVHNAQILRLQFLPVVPKQTVNKRIRFRINVALDCHVHCLLQSEMGLQSLWDVDDLKTSEDHRLLLGGKILQLGFFSGLLLIGLGLGCLVGTTWTGCIVILSGGGVLDDDVHTNLPGFQLGLSTEKGLR